MGGTAAGAAKARKHRAAKLRAKEETKGLHRLMRRARRHAELQAERTGGGFISGLEINLGRIESDTNPKFRELKTRLDAFDLMGTDAKIAAQERANILPLFSAVRASVEGGDQEQRDLIEQNLLRRGDPRFWCETSWLQRILEKMMCLRYGFALHGKTWDTVDGYRILSRLTYLHPKSLGGPLGAWEWSKDGSRLVAIHRQYRKPDGSVEIDERISVDLLCASVWWMTGENWEGQSLMRSMYRNWVTKDLASKIAMIALMNGGVGIPMGTLGPGDGPVAQEKLKTITKDLRQGSKERQFIVLANGQKIEFLTTNGAIVDARPIIQEQNMDIASAGSTDFMQSGQTASGSRAGSSVMMVSYMQQLDATVRWLEEQINHGAGYLRGEVEDLLLANFEPSRSMAGIRLSRVSPTEQLDNVPNICDAVQKGGMLHDLSVENHNRKALGVPELSQEQFDSLKAEAAPKNLGGRPDSPTPTDKNEPRDDEMGRAFGLRGEKKTPDASRPTRSGACWPWLRSS
jgi:hypothetical protein